MLFYECHNTNRTQTDYRPMKKRTMAIDLWSVLVWRLRLFEKIVLAAISDRAFRCDRWWCHHLASTLQLNILCSQVSSFLSYRGQTWVIYLTYNYSVQSHVRQDALLCAVLSVAHEALPIFSSRRKTGLALLEQSKWCQNWREVESSLRFVSFINEYCPKRRKKKWSNPVVPWVAKYKRQSKNTAFVTLQNGSRDWSLGILSLLPQMELTTS